MAAAVGSLETARKLEELPATRNAFVSGDLSGLQASEIAGAAAVDPDAEQTLLDAARAGSVASLREKCRAVVATGRDADADERIHRSRYLRHWLDADGAVRLDARLTPDAGARLIATLRARTDDIRDRAKRAGSRERTDAHAADALVSLMEPHAGSVRAVVHVHVDEAAWSRGHAVRGENCSISGVGPVSVAAARRLAAGGEIKAVLTDGRSDVRAVAHFGRTISARVRTALEARDRTCVVPGCDERDALEIDHIIPLAGGGATKIDNLARLCRWHHSLKTHRGWALAGGPGRWKFFKPKRGAT